MEKEKELTLERAREELSRFDERVEELLSGDDTYGEPTIQENEGTLFIDWGPAGDQAFDGILDLRRKLDHGLEMIAENQ